VVDYFLSMLRSAYKELERQVESVEARPAKSDLVRQTVFAQLEPSTLADMAAQLPAASPQLIKKVLAEMKQAWPGSVSGPRARGALGSYPMTKTRSATHIGYLQGRKERLNPPGAAYVFHADRQAAHSQLDRGKHLHGVGEHVLGWDYTIDQVKTANLVFLQQSSQKPLQRGANRSKGRLPFRAITAAGDIDV
jgi:hypothetical protein